jgi:hypothetical protein
VSRYEVLEAELGRLRKRQAWAVLAPTAASAVGAAQVPLAGGARLWVVVAVALVAPLLLHVLWRALFRPYRAWSDRAAQAARELRGLRARISQVFGGYRGRQKGEHFKKAYALTGRSQRELEEALAVGMYRERREVFVTAFMRAGVAVRVTASIGSPYRCSAADNPRRWREHAERLGCDEIRQYHNHPAHDGHTRPSPTDVRTSRSLLRLLGPGAPPLRSLIICWNPAREWRIFEHDGRGRSWLHFEYDAAA